MQALPYLLVVLLLAVLTLAPGWAGLQPVDAVLLLAAWGLYITLALLRPPQSEARRAEPPAAPTGASSGAAGAGAIGWAVLVGVPAIALGARASVLAARRLGAAFGASDQVVGLFVIGLLCAIPESFAA